MDSTDVFKGVEINFEFKEEIRYFVITNVKFFTFEILHLEKGIVKLISFTNITSLLNIKRRKEDNSTLILTWKDQLDEVLHVKRKDLYKSLD